MILKKQNVIPKTNKFYYNLKKKEHIMKYLQHKIIIFED